MNQTPEAQQTLTKKPESMAKKVTVFILKTITSIALTIIILFAVCIAGVRLVGLNVYMVISPSMEPTCPVGSVIWVKKISDPSKLKENDVVTFRLTEKTTATHRIIEIKPDDTDPAGYVFITKGDNNDNKDNVPLSPSKVVGKEIVTIPYLGYVANYIQHKPGIYYAIGTCLTIIVLLFITDALTDDDDDDNKKKKNKAKAVNTDTAEPKAAMPGETPSELSNETPTESQGEAPSAPQSEA
jgi:signal peptidase